MKTNEKAELILKTAKYINSGRKLSDYQDCMTKELADHLSQMKKSIENSDLMPDSYCIDMGAVLKSIESDHIFRIEYPVSTSARNGMGNLQGGLMASLIDNAMGILVVPTYGAFMTMNLEVNYFLPVSEEFDTIEIRVEIVKPGKRTKYLRAEVFRSDGKLAALAGSNVMMVKK